MKNVESLLTFESDVGVTEIAKNRDLCIKALTQDVSINAKIENCKKELKNKKEIIEKINTKPKPVVVSDQHPPYKPYVQPFRWSHLLGGYKVIDWQWDYADLVAWICTFVLTICSTFMLMCAGFAVSYIRGTVQNDFWWIMLFTGAGTTLIAGILFAFKFFMLKVVLTVLYWVLYGFTFPIYLIVNFVRFIVFKRRRAHINAEYTRELEEYNKKLRENYNLSYHEQMKKAIEEIDAKWQEGEKERLETTERLSQEINEIERYLSELYLAKEKAEKVFICPEDYSDLKTKMVLLGFLENIKAYTLKDAIRYYDQCPEREKIKLQRKYTDKFC